MVDLSRWYRLRLEQFLMTSSFVEILGIALRDGQKKSEHRVVIEHRTRALETFEGRGKEVERTIGCQTYVLRVSIHATLLKIPSQALLSSILPGQRFTLTGRRRKKG